MSTKQQTEQAPELVVKVRSLITSASDDSNYLRGTIAEDLEDTLSAGFRSDNFQLIRFHGMYAQDDRDIRPGLVERKLEPRKNVMLRCRLPGGITTPSNGWALINLPAKAVITAAFD